MYHLVTVIDPLQSTQNATHGRRRGAPLLGDDDRLGVALPERDPALPDSEPLALRDEGVQVDLHADVRRGLHAQRGRALWAAGKEGAVISRTCRNSQRN